MNTANIEDSDDYLIELIGLKEDFPKEALAAYSKIYEGYWEVMYAIAIDICKYSREPDKEAEDLVSDTFNNMYFKKAKSFDKTKINQNYIRPSVINWLKTIMLSVRYDLYIDERTKEILAAEKKKKKVSEENNIEIQDSCYIPNVALKTHLEDAHQDFIESLDNRNSNDTETINEKIEETKNDELVYNYIKTLTEKEADIVRTIYLHYVPGKNTPSELLDFLETRWGTKRDNIRRIMKKFRDRIKEDLKEKIIISR